MLLGAVSRDQDDDLRQPVPAHKCEMLDRSVEPDDIGTALFDLDARMQGAVGAKAVFHLKPDIAGGLTGGPAAAVGRISARNNAGCASPQPRRSWDVARGYQKAAQIVRGPLSCAHPEIVTGSPDLFASGLPAGDQSAL